MSKTKCQRCGGKGYLLYKEGGLAVWSDPCPDCTPNSSPRPTTGLKKGERHRKAVQKMADFNESEIRKEINADPDVVKMVEDDEIKYFVSVELVEQEGPLETEILQRKNYFYKTNKEAKAKFEQMTGVLKSKPEYMKQAEDCMKAAQMNVLKEKLSKAEQTKSEDVLIKGWGDAFGEAINNFKFARNEIQEQTAALVMEMLIRQLLLDQHRKSREAAIKECVKIANGVYKPLHGTTPAVGAWAVIQELEPLKSQNHEKKTQSSNRDT